MHILFSILLLLAGLITQGATRPAQPATKPSLAVEPFKVVQTMRVREGGGPWEDRQELEIWFDGNYAATVPSRMVETVYRLDPPAYLKDKKFGTLKSAVRLAEEQRSGPVWQALIAREEDGAFFRAMVYPELTVTEEGGVITATNGPITAVISASLRDGEPPLGAAQSYAQFYRVSSVENGMGGIGDPPKWFVPALLADLLASRDLLPARFDLSTRTPTGTADIEMRTRIEKLYPNERERLKRATAELEAASTRPTTQTTE